MKPTAVRANNVTNSTNNTANSVLNCSNSTIKSGINPVKSSNTSFTTPNNSSPSSGTAIPPIPTPSNFAAVAAQHNKVSSGEETNVDVYCLHKIIIELIRLYHMKIKKSYRKIQVLLFYSV